MMELRLFQQLLGYLIMNVTIGGTMGITAEMVAESNMYVEILGIPTIQTGVLGGIIIGFLLQQSLINFMISNFHSLVVFSQVNVVYRLLRPLLHCF